jgi:hypothetical protein
MGNCAKRPGFAAAAHRMAEFCRSIQIHPPPTSALERFSKIAAIFVPDELAAAQMTRSICYEQD